MTLAPGWKDSQGQTLWLISSDPQGQIKKAFNGDTRMAVKFPMIPRVPRTRWETPSILGKESKIILTVKSVDMQCVNLVIQEEVQLPVFTDNYQIVLWRISKCTWQILWKMIYVSKNIIFLGNCDIHFFNFRHCQVKTFKILNLVEINQNFAVIFWKYQEQNQKSTKYFAISQKSSVIPLKFREMSLVSWNLVNYCKLL